MPGQDAIQSMNVLVLVNSASPAYPEIYPALQAYLEHFGVPTVLVDLNQEPLPAGVEDFALILAAHPRLDPLRTKLNTADLERLKAAVHNGTGLVSFDSWLFPNSSPAAGKRSAASRVSSLKVVKPHYITQSHAAGQEM